jgi:hypothetical protein
MAYSQHKHCRTLIIDPADSAIVTDPISPKAHLLPGQGFSHRSGILLARNTILQELDDSLSGYAVEPLKFNQGSRFEINCPGQAAS